MKLQWSPKFSYTTGSRRVLPDTISAVSIEDFVRMSPIIRRTSSGVQTNTEILHSQNKYPPSN